MESKEKQPQVQPTPTPKPAPAPAPVAKPTPCQTQVQDYSKCLDSFTGIFTGCRSEQTAFKSCSEFDKWVETTVKSKKTVQ